MKTILRQEAESNGWPWLIDLHNNPDRVLIDTDQLIASSDAWILDRCRKWLDLAREIITRHVSDAEFFP